MTRSLSECLGRWVVVGICLSSSHLLFAQSKTPDVVPPDEVSIEPWTMSINGQSEIPRAVFGVQGSGLSAQWMAEYGVEAVRSVFLAPGVQSEAVTSKGKIVQPFDKMALVIDCQGGKHLPATVLTNPSYVEHMRTIGQGYAKLCKQAGWKGCVEFWNEPFLYWADRGRKNYLDAFFDVSVASDNGPVTIKGRSEPLTHLRWRRYWAAYEVERPRRPTESGNSATVKERRIAWSIKVPDGLRAGDTFEGQESGYWTDRTRRTFTVVEEWHVVDPTQVRWWSGRQNLEFYNSMLVPFAQAVKESAPETTVIAGWGFNLSALDWSVWKELYVPVLAAAAPWIDGLNEHHYQVDTRWIPVWYEMATSYALMRHNRVIKMYNTESGGATTPAVDGYATLPTEMRETARDAAGEATYMLRDLAEILYFCPDKAGSRIVVDPEEHPGMMEVLRLLKPLRGKLVRTSTASRDLWTVAAVNSNRLVVLVFNNANAERNISLKVAAPENTTLAAGTATWLVVDPASGNLRQRQDQVTASGKDAKVLRTLGALQAVRYEFPLSGKIPDSPKILRRQYYPAEGTLQKVAPGETLLMKVSLPSGARNGVDRMAVRMALENCAENEVGLSLNGTAIPIKARLFTDDYAHWGKLNDGANELVFSAMGEPSDGFQIDAVSLVLDTNAR